MKSYWVILIVVVVIVIAYVALVYLPSRTLVSCYNRTSYGAFDEECPDLTVTSRPRFRIVKLSLFN